MEDKRGNLLILASALCFSLGGLCIKMIPWHGMSIHGGRSLISTLVLLIYLRATKKRLTLNRSTLLGAACVFGATMLYSVANTMTTAANAILIQYVAPVFIIFMMWAFFKERPRSLDVVTCILVFGGIFCFFYDGLGTGQMLGNVLALGSGICYAGIFIMNKLPGGDSFSSTFMGHLAGGVSGLPFLVREHDFSLVPLCFILLLGVVQMGVGYICFCAGIKRTAPVTASLLSGIEPVLNPILVAVFVGEFISPLSLVGGVIVLLAVTGYNVILARRQPPKPLEAPEDVPLAM